MRRLALLFSLASVWALTATASANAKVLFGDMNQANYADSNAAGTAQAFQFVANTAGSASDIDVYVNSGSTASTLSVGLYSDANGKPGSLVASGSLKSPKAKAWNDVKLGSSQTIVQGDGYWIALLGTGGKLNYLDTTSGTASSYVDSSTGLSSLPQTFSAGAEYKVSPVSAYVNGTAGTPAMLVGDKSVAPSSDSNGAGFAQAFSYQAATSGTTTDIDLYVNSGTTATKLLLGVYSNNGGQPGSLLTSGSISSPRAGTWNDVTVGAVTLTQGTSYWIALLGTGGQIDYPDTWGGSGQSYTDSASGMTSLPATYSAGTEYSASPASAYVNGMTSGSPQQPAAPTNSAVPAVTGQTVQGQTLTTSNGTWTGSPTSYAYQWQDCNSSGASCSNISGATSSTYVLKSSDVGDTIRSVVTATNSGGSVSASSAATTAVTAPSSGGGNGGGGGSGSGSQIYVSQSGAGASSGADCGDAKPVSFFNSSSDWGSGAGQIGPGVTVDLCGTISTPLSVQGSGTSSSPITVYWTSGSTMSSADWSGGPAINTNGNDYLTFNGGNNGTSIQATAEGTGLADQGVASQGIYALSCAGCTFENLTIANLYVHTSTSDTSVDQTEDNGIVFSGSNITVADNTIHDVGWAVFSRWGNGDANNRIYGNNVYNIDHGIILTANGTVGPMFVYDNHVHDMGNWDAETSSGGLPYHHDGIHCFGPENGATYNGLYIYDNRFDGTVGQLAPTAQIFLEGNYGSTGDTPCAAVGSQVDVFNNIFGSSDYPTSNGYLETSQPGGGVYNNTVIGVNNTQNIGSCVGYRQNASGTTVAFQNNLLSTCDFLISGTPTTFTAGSPDYNVYANGGENSFTCNDNYYTFSQFASWQSCMGADTHSKASSSADLNSNGSPQSGSPATGAGNNLTSMCTGNLTPLCTTYTGPPAGGAAGSTTTGTTRPTSGAWNAGAY